MFSNDCDDNSRGDGIPDRVKKQVEETMPHYGHVGVIQAARELSKQLDNLAEDDSDEQAICDRPTDKELGGICFLVKVVFVCESSNARSLKLQFSVFV